MIPAELRPHRDYLRLWMARILGVAAQQMMMVALSWQLYALTGSAWDLGLMGLLQLGPAVALVLPAGQVIDRVHRARLLSLCFGVLAACSSVFMLAALSGKLQRELILAMAVLLGAVKAFQMPAQQALLPLLVPASVLPRAVAFGSIGLQVAIIGGPALGGWMLSLGPSALYATCTAMLVVAALMCLRIRHAAPASGEQADWHSLWAGVRFVRDRPILLGALALDLCAVVLGGATALLPIFAKDVLHVGPEGLGLLRSAPALGALMMSVVISRWPISRGTGRKLLWSVAAYGMATLVFGLSSIFWVSMLALAATGAADMVSVVVRQTLVQLETPDAMRGRVSAVNALFINASNQLGEFESGATAALMGPVASVVLGGLGAMALAALWPRWFPELSRRDALVPAPKSVRD